MLIGEIMPYQKQVVNSFFLRTEIAQLTTLVKRGSQNL